MIGCCALHNRHVSRARRFPLDANGVRLCFPAGRGSCEPRLSRIPDPDRRELVAMEEPEDPSLAEQLADLKQQHRDLDSAIESLEQRGFRDQLQLRRLKKRKLLLKDEISKIEDQLLPDIIA
jgi:hypothetical protein